MKSGTYHRSVAQPFGIRRCLVFSRAWPCHWLLVLISVSSCIPDPLEVRGIPEVKSQIVVSSQIVPDRTLAVLLTRTLGALDASDETDPQALLDQIAVNDALVTVTGAGRKDTLEFLGNGLYGGVVIPFQPGRNYTLKVNSETMGEVKATTIAKPQVSFRTIRAELYNSGYNDTLAQVTYGLKDPIVQNWYMINVQEVEREDVIDNLINPWAYTRLVSDEAFNGGEFDEQFRVFPNEYRTGDTVAVSLSNISEEYYRFMKLRIDNRFSLVEFLGEPINYPSNVEGGKGFFNLYVPDIRLFVLERPRD
ncbi:DUF4249 family protein [Fulvivirgaceae bacterium PWU4]|uniref:DUF4249 family protein n=1 Tax=Chryseosolibacter histidini TaxID=2782349 RepID=A0AAP2DRF7_9BACT|nr:DUF4249 domain-containing protein [Chryseosolibacter histidini]MBT1701133.1 DUF4249 family protein [Chryseosolibacter histidini]